MFMELLYIKITVYFSLYHIRKVISETAVQLQTSGLNSVGSNIFHRHRNKILALEHPYSLWRMRIAQRSQKKRWVPLSLCEAVVSRRHVLKGPTLMPKFYQILIYSHISSPVFLNWIWPLRPTPHSHLHVFATPGWDVRQMVIWKCLGLLYSSSEVCS